MTYCGFAGEMSHRRISVLCFWLYTRKLCGNIVSLSLTLFVI
jgi:hypothetical protein